MRWTRRETARIEKPSNQPLSVSVIFSLLSFPSAAAFYFLPSPSVLPLGFQTCGPVPREGWQGGRTRPLPGILLQDYLLTSCNVETLCSFNLLAPADLLSVIFFLMDCHRVAAHRRSGNKCLGLVQDTVWILFCATELKLKRRKDRLPNTESLEHITISVGGEGGEKGILSKSTNFL